MAQMKYEVMSNVHHHYGVLDSQVVDVSMTAEQLRYGDNWSGSKSQPRHLSGHIFELQFTDLSHRENVNKAEASCKPVLST